MCAVRNLLAAAVGVMLLACASVLCAAGAPNDEAWDLLRRSLNNGDVMRRISFEARSEYWQQRAGKPRTTVVDLVRFRRYDAFWETRSVISGTGGVTFSQSTRVVVTPECVVWLPGPPGTVPKSIAYAGRDAAHRVTSGSGIGRTDAYLDGCPDIYNMRNQLSPEALSLRRLQPEKIGDWQCEVIEGECRYGEFRLWIAPERNFHQVRWRVLRQPHHYIHDAVAGDMLFRDWDPKCDSSIVQVEVTEFEQLDGKVIPVAGFYRTSFHAKDGTVLGEQEGVMRRSQIKLLTDRAEVEDAFKIEVPDGTFVNNQDDRSGVQYEWRGGRVVRGHTEFGGAARGHWQPRSPWVYICWVVLALGLAGTALRVWYVRRAKAAREAP